MALVGFKFIGIQIPERKLSVLQATNEDVIGEELEGSDRHVGSLLSDLFKFRQRLIVRAQEFPRFDFTVSAAREQKVFSLNRRNHHAFDHAIVSLSLRNGAARSEKHVNSMHVLVCDSLNDDLIKAFHQVWMTGSILELTCTVNRVQIVK